MELFDDPIWQMSLGERAAMEGLLSALKPALAIEVGTAEGACLRRIAEHAGEVHSFDLVTPSVGDLPDHVHLHTGDSHELLPQVLERFAAEGRIVDFVLVDGDHSADGVRRDIEALLASPAIADSVIVMHDIANELVREGVDAVPYGAFAKVAHVDLDFVAGYLGRDRFHGELWGGLGLVIVDSARPAYGSGPSAQTDRHHGGELLAIARDVLLQRPAEGLTPGYDPRARRLADAYLRIDALGRRIIELEAAPAGRPGEPAHTPERRADEPDGALEHRVAALAAEVEHHRALVGRLMASPSWRVTAPLRAAKRAVTMLRHRDRA